eukprot:8672554-Heterocapsa_arctica.AAC.1
MAASSVWPCAAWAVMAHAGPKSICMRTRLATPASSDKALAHLCLPAAMSRRGISRPPRVATCTTLAR